MTQAISGVTPPSVAEATIMTVWPSMAATGPGQLIGRLCGVQLGFGWFNLGKLFALLSIPFALAIFAGMHVPPSPWGVRRYRLTNRRLMIENGLLPRPERWVDLDGFDRIEVDVKPGQEWFPAGDLVFYKGAVETFRLFGVPRPETFRRTLLKAHQGFVGVAKALANM
jgi:hypothetical protein